MGWQWHQLDHMQITWTSLQTDNHASTSPLNFYCPDALPDTEPTVSKHWRHTDTPSMAFINRKNLASKTSCRSLFSARFHLDRCIMSPLLGQKLQIWPNLDYLWLTSLPLHLYQQEICHGRVNLWCALPTKFHDDWCIMPPMGWETAGLINFYPCDAS